MGSAKNPTSQRTFYPIDSIHLRQGELPKVFFERLTE